MSTITLIPSKREDFERLTGFAYIKEQIAPKTPMGHTYFKHLQTLGVEKIAQHLEDTEVFLSLLRSPGFSKYIEEIEHDLECVVDISHTLKRLSDGNVLDEIELFELKNFLIVSENLRRKTEVLFSNASQSIPQILSIERRFHIPDLSKPLDILDPEGLRIPTFYIYDAYDERLKEIRQKKRSIFKEELNKSGDSFNSPQMLELTQREYELEAEVLEKISMSLKTYSKVLSEAIDKVQYLDVILAKARLANDLKLSKPNLRGYDNCDKIEITGMFNPQLRNELEEKGKSYQPVDVVIEEGVTLIVGANMSGKSVVLRTVALIEYMALLGFFIPAKSAFLPVVSAIALVTEDAQKPLSGLSSFASEILMIDEAYKIAKEKRKALILIDEPARTTNPYEGSAIVNAIVKAFESTNCWTLIVTHFDDIKCEMRYRVKGLKPVQNTNLLLKDIQDLMDYSLIPDASTSVPKEALRVMEILNISEDLVDEAKNNLRKINKLEN